MNFFDWLRQTRNNAQHFGNRDTRCDVPWSHLKTLFDVLDDYTFGQVVSKTEHDRRVSELLEANSALVERNRRLIHILKHGGAEFFGLEIKTPWEYPPYGHATLEQQGGATPTTGEGEVATDSVQDHSEDAELQILHEGAGESVLLPQIPEENSGDSEAVSPEAKDESPYQPAAEGEGS
jgi:hypothetical protein